MFLHRSRPGGEGGGERERAWEGGKRDNRSPAFVRGSLRGEESRWPHPMKLPEGGRNQGRASPRFRSGRGASPGARAGRKARASGRNGNRNKGGSAGSFTVGGSEEVGKGDLLEASPGSAGRMPWGFKAWKEDSFDKGGQGVHGGLLFLHSEAGIYFL